ncbi:MAG: 3'-5' exoribonuclease YhaM family protein [Chitinophagales bacterium]
MRLYIADFRPGETVEVPLMVADKRLVPFRDQAKGRYLAVVLVDRTGQIEGRAWENAERLAGEFEVGDVLRVAGTVEEYREARQLRLTALRRLAEGEFELADFLPVSARDRREMEGRLDELLASVRHEGCRAALDAFFGDPEFRRLYCEAPAAKRIHHNYLGGLLEHSLEVAELVETIAGFTPALRRDLALTGALLHDIGKIREYCYRPLIDLTDQGKLLGHTVLGWELLRERLAAVAGRYPELAVELGHLILSHHGELEWGAPVLPQTLEAAAVHYADLLSGRVQQYEQVALTGESAAPEAVWSPYDGLLGRSLYLGRR